MSTKSERETIAGVILALIGNGLQGFGFVMQKLGHNKLKEYNDKNLSKPKGYLTSCYWIFGFITVLAGSATNALALKYAAQSLVLPLSVTTLLVNTILAIIILKEPWNIFDVVGIIVIIVGTVLSVIFGPTATENSWIINTFYERYLDIVFIAVMISFSVIAMFCYIYCKIIMFLNSKRVPVQDMIKSKSLTEDQPQGTIKRSGGRSGKEIKAFRYSPEKSKRFLICIVFVTSYFGSTNQLFLKTVLEIITVGGNKFFIYALFYINIFLFVITTILLEYFRQLSLKLFNSLYVVPIFQVLLIVVGSVMGGIYFNEFSSMTTKKIIGFCVGICAVILGVIVLTVSNYLNKKRAGLNVSIAHQRLKDGITYSIYLASVNNNTKSPKANTNNIEINIIKHNNDINNNTNTNTINNNTDTNDANNNTDSEGNDTNETIDILRYVSLD